MESQSGDTSSSPANIATLRNRPQLRAVPTIFRNSFFYQKCWWRICVSKQYFNANQDFDIYSFVISYRLHNNPIKVMKRRWNEKFYYSSVVCHDSRLNSSHLDVISKHWTAPVIHPLKNWNLSTNGKYHIFSRQYNHEI